MTCLLSSRLLRFTQRKSRSTFPNGRTPPSTHLNASRKERGLSHYIRQFLHLCGQRFARDDFHAKIQVTNKHTQRAIVHDDASLILPIEKKTKEHANLTPIAGYIWLS